MKKNLLCLLVLSALCGLSVNAQTQFWGTAQNGGTNNDGTIFYSDGTGNNFTTAWNFVMADGKMPVGKMVLADNNMLYGETWLGGFGDSCVIYKFDPVTGTYTNIYDLYQFTQYGWDAWGGMIKGADGMLYGLGAAGGANGYGVIFRINPWTDTYTDLYDFTTVTGSAPFGSLIQLSDGKLYGMTYYGGPNGAGTIFSYDLVSSTCTALYSFQSATGGNPQFGSLFQASNGKLYGMTPQGGASNKGVIFSFDLTTGTYVDLHDFTGDTGGTPQSTFVQAPNGLLYAMTSTGGLTDQGGLFSFDVTTNSYNMLMEFTGANGASPRRALTVNSSGMLFGTTPGGGAYNNGVAFKYNTLSNTYTKIHDFNAATTGSAPDCEIIETPVLTAPQGIQHVNSGSGFNVFPNPAHTAITVGGTCKADIITLIDATGRELAVVRTSANAKTHVDISGFPNVFFARTQSGEMKKVVRD